MPQPESLEMAYHGHTIKADKISVSVVDSCGKVVYCRESKGNQTACAMTNFQCGKAVVDGFLSKGKVEE
jgi:hypothetical protein